MTFGAGIGSPYAGVGSRETPNDVLAVMTLAADMLAGTGWVLRSGGAPGADSAFEAGATNGVVELYLPWPNFEGREFSPPHVIGLDHPTKAAWAMAAEFHPAWERLSQGARALHARNCHQICGPDVENPVLSKFVLCWTPEGSGRGGTGQAIRIARHFEVPIFDLGIQRILDRVTEWVFSDQEILL